MTRTEAIIDELNRESATTRRLLERLPEEKLGWTPHPKSRTLGALAMHIAVLPIGITTMISQRVTEGPGPHDVEPKTVDEILSTHDRSVADATARIQSWGEDGLDALWALRKEGRTIIELPRHAMLHTILMKHIVHHRGQLTVYMRMLDVPLPGIYGPTADDSRMPIE